MNFQDPLLWLVATIALCLIYFHFKDKKEKVEVVKVPEKKKRKYTDFESDFIEIEKLARVSSNKSERDEVTKLIYLFKNQYRDNPETRFNAQILEGINNRVKKEFASQYQPLN